MRFPQASLLSLAAAGSVQARFAVLRFNNEAGRFSAEGRMDPIVDPGTVAEHSHGIQGGSNFDITVQGDELLNSSCTNAKVAADKSNYWVPDVWFQSPSNGTFKKVDMFYMNVYYFFDNTNDDIVPFPPGLKLTSGNSSTTTAPATGALQLDPTQGEIQAVQWTCPVLNGDPDRYPPNSDGTTAGLPDPNNKGAGAGFPVVNCDGYASPLRQDIHMPSCYDPSAGLNNYQSNSAFPSPSPSGDGSKLDCPEGWTHIPHLFYEVYWNTPLFANDWDPNGRDQPFILSNGDRTGFSSHADFLAGWDHDVLAGIIDNCDAGTAGMDTCADAGEINDQGTCEIGVKWASPVDEWVEELPGDNVVKGWGV